MIFNKQNSSTEFSDLQREKSPTAGAAKLCVLFNGEFGEEKYVWEFSAEFIM